MKKLFVVVFTLMLIFGSAFAQGEMDWLTVRGDQIVNEKGDAVLLGGSGICNHGLVESHAFGMPNAIAERICRNTMRIYTENTDVIDDYFNRIMRHYVTPEDFKIAKLEGCDFIRYPFHHKWVESYLLDDIVRWAKQAGLYVLLDCHAAPGGQAAEYFADAITAKLWESEEYQKQFIRDWVILAERFKNEPAVLGYELLNEPVVEDGRKLRKLHERTIEAIRKVDQRHTIYLNGNHYAGDFSVFQPPHDDDNIVYVFHNYAATLKEFEVWSANAISYRDRYRKPIMCNEYVFDKGRSDWLAKQNIHYAPWCIPPLSNQWNDWIDGINKKQREYCVEEGIEEIIQRVRQLPEREQRRWKPAIGAMRGVSIKYWFRLCAESLEEMGPAEMERLCEGMRDRTTKPQFVPQAMPE